MPIREADFGRPFGIVALMILALLFVSEVASEFVDGQHGKSMLLIVIMYSVSMIHYYDFCVST